MLAWKFTIFECSIYRREKQICAKLTWFKNFQSEKAAGIQKKTSGRKKNREIRFRKNSRMNLSLGGRVKRKDYFQAVQRQRQSYT